MPPDTSTAVDHLRETPVARSQMFDGRLLHVFLDQVRRPDGGMARREVVEHPGAVAIVAVDDAGRVVLVRQWRHAIGGAIWEIPAGTREPGEDPAGTATRELAEETGFTARRWRGLGQACVSPGYSRELIWFFEARGLTAGAVHTDADEQLDVATLGAAEIGALVREGRVDCKTLAGLALAGLLPPADAGLAEPTP